MEPVKRKSKKEDEIKAEPLRGEKNDRERAPSDNNDGDTNDYVAR